MNRHGLQLAETDETTSVIDIGRRNMSRKDVIDGIREHIGTTGWSVLNIVPTEEDPDVRFSYTVGLTETFGHPEIYIVGLDHQTAHAILNELGAAIRKGKSFDQAMMSDEVLQGYPAAFRPITEITAILHSEIARAALKDVKFEATQMFYPDRKGKFPWDDDCNPRFVEMQVGMFEYVDEPPTSFDPGSKLS